MQLARVIGNVVATRKDPGLAAATLLVLQPLSPAREPVGARSWPSIRSARG